MLVFREINFSIWWTAQQTIIMSRTENQYAGRVFASYETVTTLMMVGSILVSGLAADRFGIRAVAATGGIIIALSGALWFVLGARERKLRVPDRMIKSNFEVRSQEIKSGVKNMISSFCFRLPTLDSLTQTSALRSDDDSLLRAMGAAHLVSCNRGWSCGRRRLCDSSRGRAPEAC